jgi:multidrug efflux pump subunit AcrA (membrane-fusion protein)
MKKIMKNLLLVLSVCVFIAGCKKNDAAKNSQVKDVPVFAVNTTEAVEGPISDYLSLSGDIVAGSTVDTFSDAAGKITSILVNIGSRVSKGQAIARVDPSKPGMAFVQHVVRAPISGTVVSLPAELGMTISQATSLARIAGGSALEIQLFVPERFISKIKMSLPCEISLDAYPGETFRGSITEISPTVDTASRTEQIKVNVENPGSRLKVGMFAKVKIITEHKQGIVKIPANAVITRQGQTVVFVVTPDPSDPMLDIVVQTNVVQGILVDNIVEIQSGLKSGDEIVDKGMTLLTDGARVNVIGRDQKVTIEE